MNGNAPRSIDQYLRQLRVNLAGEDSALIQDALYDAEEYLRAEVTAHPDKSEADVLELIGSTYGAPDEVASAYRDTEVKVRAAMTTPRRISHSRVGAFFNVFLDPRAYTSLFFMLLSMATGVIYFTFAVTGLALSAGLAVLVIGVPFFLLFVAVSRVVSLAEGRLIEATTGERMPRRPLYAGTSLRFWARIGQMLKDRRTWSTLVYLILMLPLGIAYFVTAVVGLVVSLSLIFAPLAVLAGRLGWFDQEGAVHLSPPWLESFWASPILMSAGILLLTTLMHLARGVGRLHAQYAKVLLVAAPSNDAAVPVATALSPG